MSAPFDLRVGNGFDIHRVGSDGTMVLGGCEFPGVAALVGHSDGDAVAHAIADGLLGAAGLGDLGSWFPDTDPSFAGADSIELLRRVVAAVAAEGWQVANADCSVICDQPKLAPRRTEMQERLAAAIAAPVSVKGRRPEGVGALGRGEAIVCFASVLLVRADDQDRTGSDRRARSGGGERDGAGDVAPSDDPRGDGQRGDGQDAGDEPARAASTGIGADDRSRR